MIFRCLKDFYEGENKLKILDHNDEIHFSDDLHYKVWSFSLGTLPIVGKDPVDPGKIFNVLGIENKKEFCYEHYGYSLPSTENIDYGFPEFNSHDYTALTKAVVVLMELWEQKK